jgi:hypothetical protein
MRKKERKRMLSKQCFNRVSGEGGEENRTVDEK